MYSVIIQGPILINEDYIDFISSMIESSFIEKVIYSSVNKELTNSLLGKFKDNNKIIISDILDVGINPGSGKPLNVNRYLVGVKNSLQFVNSNKVIVIRSDIIFDVEKLILIDKKKTNGLIVLDVTTKTQFFKKRWFDHFCDWLYVLDTNLAKKSFEQNNYKDYSENIKKLYSSRFPLSPEKYIFIKFKEVYKNNIYKHLIVLNHRKINLKCLKVEYKEIPFGINKKYQIFAFEIYLLKVIKTFKNLRYINQPLGIIRYVLFYKFK